VNDKYAHASEHTRRALVAPLTEEVFETKRGVPMPGSARTDRVVARLRQLLERCDPADARRARRLAAALSRVRDPEAIWVLLSWLERSPADVLDSGERFAALTRLVEADCGFLRSAAHRWLARMFLIDLRYEQRAKRVLCDALDRESGIARARIRQLLRRC